MGLKGQDCAVWSFLTLWMPVKEMYGMVCLAIANILRISQELSSNFSFILFLKFFIF